MTIQEKYGFRKVINARGPATLLGAARVSEAIRSDISAILAESAEMWELQRSASDRIVKLTGAEAGCVVNCSSAGMVIAAAAALTGNDPARIKALPDIDWSRKKIVIQKGQVTGAGDCPVWQVIKMTGAHYVEIGEALDCATYHLRSVLDENTAAAFYIMMDSFAPNLLPLETFTSICHEKGVPVICDAAYYTDFKKLAALGVDMAIYSGQKWLGGCTSGIIAGRRDLIHACYLQELGVGRPMKVGKEGIISIMAAIDQWQSSDFEAIRREQAVLAESIIREIDGLDGVDYAIKESQYSPSVRLHVQIDPIKAGISAATINTDMGRLDPVIKTDDYLVGTGCIIFDFAFIARGDEKVIAKALHDYLTGARKPAITDQPLTRQDAIFKIMDGWLDGDPRS